MSQNYYFDYSKFDIYKINVYNYLFDVVQLIIFIYIWIVSGIVFVICCSNRVYIVYYVEGDFKYIMSMCVLYVVYF